MANDLFAPPTEDEIKAANQADLFAPPTAAEIGESEPQTSASRAGLDSFANSALMGYLPQAQSLASKAANALLPTPGADVDRELEAKGFKISQPGAKSYLEMRDENIQRLKTEQDEHPVASGVGAVGGALAGGVALGGLGGAVKGATALERAAAAARAGGIMGGLYNPGDVEGEINPIQAGARLKNAAIGAGAGAAIQGGIDGLGKVGEAASKYWKDKAAEKAFKTSGAMLKDFRAANARGKVEEIGREMLDSGVVDPLATPKTVLNRVQEKIPGLESELDDAIRGTEEKIRASFDSLSPEQKRALQNTRFAPQEVAEKLKQQIRDKYGMVPEEKLKPAFDEIDTWLSRPDRMGVQELQDMKVQMNRFLKDSDFYKQPQSFAKEGILAVRKALKEGIENKADAFEKVLGNEGGRVKEINRRLGNLYQVEDIAADRLSRDSANRAFGLTDTIHSGAGAAVGASVGGPVGAAIGGAVGGFGNKLARTYGNSLMATGFDKASELAKIFPRLAAVAKNNPEAAAYLEGRLFPQINGGQFVRDMTTHPALSNPQILERFRQNPKLIDSVQNDKLREQIKAALERAPSAGVPEQRVDEKEAQERFLQGN